MLGGLGLGLGLENEDDQPGGTPPTPPRLLLEDGFHILLEDGSFILLE